MSHHSHQWQPDLDSYPKLTAMTFPSDEEVEKAIDLLWAEELNSLPHELVGGLTIIVPAEATEHFQAAGLQFTVDEVTSASELPAEELNELRKQGPY